MPNKIATKARSSRCYNYTTLLDLFIIVYTCESPFTISTSSCGSALALSKDPMFRKSFALSLSTNRAPNESHITLIVVLNLSLKYNETSN